MARLAVRRAIADEGNEGIAATQGAVYFPVSRPRRSRRAARCLPFRTTNASHVVPRAEASAWTASYDLSRSPCSQWDTARWPTGFDLMLRTELGMERHLIARDGPLRYVVFEVMRVAEREGWLPELFQAAHAIVPTSP